MGRAMKALGQLYAGSGQVLERSRLLGILLVLLIVIAVLVLATDGDPTECDTSISGIDAIAASGVSMSPKISTFVIGVGSSLSNLNSIAMAGGTQQAFLVDTGGNVNQQFLAAMNAIRGRRTKDNPHDRFLRADQSERAEDLHYA